MKLVVTVFFLHFLADWVLQSPKMGREKSNKFKVLCAHISIIFLVLFIGTLPLLSVTKALVLSAINALTHAIVDWNIWRFYRVTVLLRNRELFKKLGKAKAIEQLKTTFKYWLDPVFGYFLGFDQLLHFIFLYLVYTY